MSRTTSVTTQQTRVANALVPPEGPKSVSVPLDFTGGNTKCIVDFTLAHAQTTMTVVQTIWADNSANADPLSITVSGTGQTINVPAGAQGSFPIIAAIRPVITITNAGGGIIPCLFLNVPLPASVWYPNGVPVIPSGGSSTGIATTIINAQQTINATPTLITAPLTGTQWLIVVNLGTTDVYFGTATVSASNGLLLPGIRGAALVLPVNTTLYGIVATGTGSISLMLGTNP